MATASPGPTAAAAAAPSNEIKGLTPMSRPEKLFWGTYVTFYYRAASGSIGISHMMIVIDIIVDITLRRRRRQWRRQSMSPSVSTDWLVSIAITNPRCLTVANDANDDDSYQSHLAILELLKRFKMRKKTSQWTWIILSIWLMTLGSEFSRLSMWLLSLFTYLSH